MDRRHLAVLLVLVEQSVSHARVARPRREATDHHAYWLLVTSTAWCRVTGDGRVTGRAMGRAAGGRATGQPVMTTVHTHTHTVAVTTTTHTTHCYTTQHHSQSTNLRNGQHLTHNSLLHHTATEYKPPTPQTSQPLLTATPHGTHGVQTTDTANISTNSSYRHFPIIPDSDQDVCRIAQKMWWIRYLLTSLSVVDQKCSYEICYSTVVREWKSDLESVSRTGSPPKVNQFF